MAGNDILFGGSGNDTISGGAGFDRAIFEQAMSAYDISRLADGNWRVSDVRAGGTEGDDIVLSNVEQLVFTDATFDLQLGEVSDSLTAYDYLFVV